MKLFKDIITALLDPTENAERFTIHCDALFRRALRLPPLYNSPEEFPPEAVALCVCSHLCGISIVNAHRTYSSMLKKNHLETMSLSEETASFVHENGWKKVAKRLGIEKGSQNGKGRPLLFEDYTFFFVPSLLFSERASHLLLTRVEEQGGKGLVLMKGEQGLKESQARLKGDLIFSTDTYICADVSLTTKYSDTYKLRTVPPKWVRDCLRDSRIRDIGLYLPKGTNAKLPGDASDSSSGNKRNREVRDEVNRDFTAPKRPRPSDDTEKEPKRYLGNIDHVFPQATIPIGPSLAIKGAAHEEQTRFFNWACERRTAISRGDFPMNEKICELLGIILQDYQAKKDSFRTIGYQKAIAKIGALGYELTTVDDVRALSSGKGVGDRIERKVIEIVTTGRLLQAEAVLANCDNKAVRELCDVWGVGPVKALNLVAHGIRSVKELRAAVQENPSLLDRNQKIGLRYYEDLLLRIPRKNVTELEGFVRMISKSIDQSIDIRVAGSYLRGKKDCGDVDIIVHGSRDRLVKAFPKIKDKMRRKGVLTDDLIDGDFKYFGIFQLPGRPHARIDLFAVPEEEYPFALLTYTGSAIFNRSMRAKARALGYSLSHKGLLRVNRSKHAKTRVEPAIRVKNEQEIFLLLDIPYVEPAARSI